MTRSALHKLIDEISDREIDRIAALVQAVRDNDQLRIQLLMAQEVDAEPGDLERLEQARGEHERGETVDLKDYLQNDRAS